MCCRCPQQLGTRRVGVEAELFHLGLTHRPHHGRRGEIRAFVGVQLNVLLVLRLFARGVGSDSFQRGRKKTAHSKFLSVFGFMGSGLALSVIAYAMPPLPKGEAFGSPFEERLPPVGGRCRASDRKGNLARSA